MQLLKINKTVLATVLITLICTSSVYAWSRGGKCPFADGAKDKPQKRMMDLTSEQKEQLTDLRQKFIDDTAEARISLNTAYKNLDILMETTAPDKKAVNALIKEISDLRETLLEKRINHQLEAKKIAPGIADGRMFRGWRHKDGFNLMNDDRGPADFSPGKCCGGKMRCGGRW